MDVLVLVFCAWGVSAWLPWPAAPVRPALRALVGLWLSLLLLLVLFVIPGMSLSLATGLTATAAGLGWCLLGWRCAGRRPFSVGKVDPLHPCLVAFPIILVTSLASEHQFTKIDEFTHWLLMPYQYYFADTLTTTHLPSMQFADYTPGLPLLCLLAPGVRGVAFQADQALAPMSMLGCLTLGALYELLLNLFARAPMGGLDDDQKRIAALVLCLFFAAIGLAGDLFPHYVLIEPPQMGTIAVMGLAALCLPRAEGETARLGWAGLVGLALAVGYLFKKPMLLLAPGVLLLAFACYARRRDLRLWVLLFGPLAAVYGVWAWISAPFPVKWQLAEARVPFADILFSASAWLLLGDMLSAVAQLMLHPTNSLLPLCSLLLLFLLKRGTAAPGRLKTGAVLLASWTPLLLLWGLLFWMYLFVFADWERASLASFTRYSQVFLRPAALVLLVFWLTERWSPRGFPSKVRLTKGVVLCAWVCLAGLCSEPFFKERGKTDPLMNTHLPLFLQQRALLPKSNPKVMLVTGPEVGDYFRVRFGGLMDPRLRYQTDPAFHFVRDPARARHFSTVIDAQGLRACLLRQDLLWLHATAPWIEQVVADLPPYPEGPLIFRPSDHEK
ncbi:hypothetical protein [Acanthopleuribacter pedis]|uniref:Uncharacterized protein n=1 Tax=Acanthopleuribacter pedis TaxID=442870 RepID=A0A8J7QMM4_9BACT|nr:hypothetical protein [Acanthopleuribacter pedis]MBO1320785.1 hypothetical protein [Acanthopleuribacter pedis]